MELLDYTLSSDVIWDDDIVKKRYDQYVKSVKDLTKNGFKPYNKRYRQGYYIPKLKNAGKVINIMYTDEPQPIVYRSSWEQMYFRWASENPNVLLWGSEICRVLYKNPFTNKQSFYVVDAFQQYIDKQGVKHNCLIEIKPENETKLEETTNGHDRVMWAINQVKWAAAIQYAKKRNMEFRILTNRDFGA